MEDKVGWGGAAPSGSVLETSLFASGGGARLSYSHSHPGRVVFISCVKQLLQIGRTLAFMRLLYHLKAVILIPLVEARLEAIHVVPA